LDEIGTIPSPGTVARRMLPRGGAGTPTDVT
jgi:hypothetical protein